MDFLPRPAAQLGGRFEALLPLVLEALADPQRRFVCLGPFRRTLDDRIEQRPRLGELARLAQRRRLMIPQQPGQYARCGSFASTAS